jgi:hypothetical protein
VQSPANARSSEVASTPSEESPLGEELLDGDSVGEPDGEGVLDELGSPLGLSLLEPLAEAVLLVGTWLAPREPSRACRAACRT